MQAVANMLQEKQSKVTDENKRKKVRSEWKFVAMVVDRLCFCIFTLFFVIATLFIFRHQLLSSSAGIQR